MTEKRHHRIAALFKSGGQLAKGIETFEYRDGQVELVNAIGHTIEEKSHLIAEAGTGIGKTFAYLLPALSTDKKTLVSTATKHLQEQVFFKDLPIIEKIMGKNIATCLLKGRGNYFCHYRFHDFLKTASALNKKHHRIIGNIQSWSEKTLSGDLAEIAEFSAEDIGMQKRITSTTDNCLSGECPYFDSCFVQKNREKAKKSDLIITNHALLMSDITLKEAGFAEILPDVGIVIIDEAHHLPTVATQAFAEKISASQLKELARDALQVYQNDANDCPEFREYTEHLLTAVDNLVMSLAAQQEKGQIALSELRQLPHPYRCFQQLMLAFKPFLHSLTDLSVRTDNLKHIYERAQTTALRIKHIFQSPDVNISNDNQPENAIMSQSVALLDWGDDFFSASRLPIHLGSRFTQTMQTYADSWIFVSATLSVDRSFDFFQTALGLFSDIDTCIIHSPFNYSDNMAIHIPKNLPEPNQTGFVEAMIDEVLPLIEKTQGRTFMLFTSYKNLHQAKVLFADSNFNVFVQGDLPKSQLIDAFIKADNAVLLGTVSFWEGVDVHGDKLCCVIIDKIPFPSPSDPMLAEQARFFNKQGKNAFTHCYVARAATLLKQGAGRLIRSHQDKGILIFCDKRIVNKSYGRQLMQSLPPAALLDKQALLNFIEDKLKPWH